MVIDGVRRFAGGKLNISAIERAVAEALRRTLSMRDATPDPQAARIDLVAEPPCCPGGACGPIFETPLLELAFNRVRDLVRGRNGRPTSPRPRPLQLVDPVLPTRASRPSCCHLTPRRMRPMTDQPRGPVTPDVEIFDPPLCCPTGLCGPVLDTTLVDLSEAIFTLEAEGRTVVRHMMTADPQAFMRNREVYELIRAAPARGPADHRHRVDASSRPTPTRPSTSSGPSSRSAPEPAGAPDALRERIAHVTQFLFFSGKGGVGKTTMACTTAVAEADAGRRVLIVTTDPASNLADVFEQPIGHAITAIAGVPNLWAMEIDPDRATAEYTDRTLAPIREIFPPEIVRVMEEQLAGPCTAEVAAFDRFADFLDPTAPASPPAGGAGFDLVIFDTAPDRAHGAPARAARGLVEEHRRGRGGRGPDVHRAGGGDRRGEGQVRAGARGAPRPVADALRLRAPARGDRDRRDATRRRRAGPPGDRHDRAHRQWDPAGRGGVDAVLRRPDRDAGAVPRRDRAAAADADPARPAPRRRGPGDRPAARPGPAARRRARRAAGLRPRGRRQSTRTAWTTTRP